MDNKNYFMFYYYSLIVVKGIFRDIHVNFMSIVYTHDDVDALFGRWSPKLKQNNYSILLLLMKLVMHVESTQYFFMSLKRF